MSAEENPFPSVPAARLTGSDDLTPLVGAATPYVTVETDAIRAVNRQLAAYLGQATGPPSRGRALAVVGDYGTGKSHIARGLVRRVTADASEPLLWLIDEPVWDFGAIYRDRLVNDLKDQKAAFYDVLLDYYSDVTADSLDDSLSLRDIADGLRRRHLDPHAVIETFTLSESAIRRDLEHRLQVLTEHGKFASALALLQFPEYQDAVWEWLMGHPPSPVLIERGITTPIDDVSSVFDALAVFAFLYGRSGRRFVLIFDMVEKALEWPRDRRIAFMQAFEKLVNVYVSVGGLLVFCVLPEALSEFRESLHERVLPIRPTPLTVPQTLELVARHLRPARQVGAKVTAADVAPFRPEAVAYIRELTGGVPRRVLKLCHHAWELAATAEGTPRRIDDVVVREAVREAFEVATRDDIRAALESVLVTGPWRFEPSATRFEHRAGQAAENVDFWIPVGRSGAAVAVVTSDSIVLDSQVDRLKRVVEAARADTGSAPCEVLVVVNGYLAGSLRQRLADLTGTQPVVYSDKHFRRAVQEAIRDAVLRLQNSGRDGALQLLRERMEGLAYQQTNVLDYLQRIDGRVEQINASSGARIGELFQMLSDAGEVPPPGAERRRGPVRSRLPQEIQRHFDRAFDTVGLMAGVPSTFRQVFSLHDPEAERPRRLNFTREQFQAVGVAVLLEKLLEAFRDSVGEWVRQVRSGPVTPTADQERRLRVICRSYDITAEMLPVFRLESLAALGPFTEELDPMEQAARSFHRAEAEQALSRLGERVFDSTMASLRP